MGISTDCRCGHPIVNLISAYGHCAQDVDLRRSSRHTTQQQTSKSKPIESWVDSIGLDDYARNLHGTGIHGGVLVLDDNMSHNELILALQIPYSTGDVSQTL